MERQKLTRRVLGRKGWISIWLIVGLTVAWERRVVRWVVVKFETPMA